MNKKRLLKFSLIGLFVFHFIVLPVVYAVHPPELKATICKKSVTIKPKQLTVTSFYMPKGSAFGIEFDIKISHGKLLFFPEISSYHETNTENMLEFFDTYDYSGTGKGRKSMAGSDGRYAHTDNACYI